MAGKLTGDDQQVISIQQATCLGGAYVDAIGLGRLKGAGITPKDFADGEGSDFDGRLTLTEDTANEVYDHFGNCGIDLAEVFKRLAGSSGGLTADQNACVDRILTDENLRRSFVADFVGDKLQDDPLDQMETCLGPN